MRTSSTQICCVESLSIRTSSRRDIESRGYKVNAAAVWSVQRFVLSLLGQVLSLGLLQSTGSNGRERPTGRHDTQIY